MSQPADLPQQLAAAQTLLDTVGRSLEAMPGYSAVREAGPGNEACNRIDHAMRRIVFNEFHALKPFDAALFVCGLASVLGAHAGRMLKGLPGDLVQTAVTEMSNELLLAIGADPTQSGVSVTVSDPQRKEPLH